MEKPWNFFSGDLYEPCNNFAQLSSQIMALFLPLIIPDSKVLAIATGCGVGLPLSSNRTMTWKFIA